MASFSPVFVDTYDPLKAGSIDGTDEFPHDRAIVRALQAKFKPNKFACGNPDHTVFIGHLSPKTTEDTIAECMKEYGDIDNVRLVRDVVTGMSKCYCFVEFEESYQARSAARNGHNMTIDEHEVLVDLEKGRTVKGWVPRRLGGGLGGKRESGQLRFGGKDRPFRRPIMRQDVPVGGEPPRAGRNDRPRERRRSRSRDKSAERHRHKGHSSRRK